MTVRLATEADAPTLRELWEEFEAEVPAPPGYEESWDEAWRDLSRHVREGAAAIAEDGDGPIGYAFASPPEKGRSQVSDVYVRPRARRRGTAKALLGAVVARLEELGAERVELEVLTANAPARAVWQRLGFADLMHVMTVELGPLADRLGRAGEAPSRASIHVLTDDERAVERALVQYVPRLGHSSGSALVPARNGWIGVVDELCDRDPRARERLAGELSDRLGAVVVSLALEEERVVRLQLFERGRMVDEYLSAPEYYGPLERADALALALNPTLAARLTGASAGELRAVARTAGSTAELPPAAETVARLAAALGIEGAAAGFEHGADLPGAHRV